MLEKVTNFLNEYYNIDKKKIKPESELVSELGLSSFQLVEMCAQMEEEFGVEIDEDDLLHIVTVNDMVDLLDKIAV